MVTKKLWRYFSPPGLTRVPELCDLLRRSTFSYSDAAQCLFFTALTWAKTKEIRDLLRVAGWLRMSYLSKYSATLSSKLGVRTVSDVFRLDDNEIACTGFLPAEQRRPSRGSRPVKLWSAWPY